MRKIELTGQKFGRLKVLHECGKDNRGERLWYCKCDCGKEIIVLSSNLRSNHTTSCGCYRAENVKTVNKTHGFSNTKIYHVWQSIKRRCALKSCKDYPNYGGRGITICSDWTNNFLSFYNWAIANGYAENLTIDRIDTNGNYEPNNCRWVTLQTQANNKRNNRMLTFNGETHTMKEWSKITGINYNTLNSRVRRGLADEYVLAGAWQYEKG